MARGFTLLELIVVLTLMSILLAVTAPKLAGRQQEAALRGVGLDLQTLASFARGRAVMSEAPVGLLLNDPPAVLRVVDLERSGSRKMPGTGDLLPPRPLPKGCSVIFKATESRAKNNGMLVFKADGSVSGGDILIADGTGHRLRYQVFEPLGAMRLVSEP